MSSSSPSIRPFQDRSEAGQQLALALAEFQDHPNGVVLGLPRGGVPVAYEIAIALRLPLDVCIVRKLGLPEQPELAMGAIAGELQILNDAMLRHHSVTPDILESVLRKERQEMQRRAACYRRTSAALSIEGKTVLVVDDGVATGSTVRAAIMALRLQAPKALIVAVPVAAPPAIAELDPHVDQIIALLKPDPLHSISTWYLDFDQTSDETVQTLLRKALNHLPPEEEMI